MKVQAFIHRHYSPAVGESPIGHAAAVLAGLTLIAIGAVLIATVVFVPVGTVISLLGLLLLAGGVFAHIQSPLKFADLMDALIGLTGAAIAMTFALAVAAVAFGFALTALFEILQWLVH